MYIYTYIKDYVSISFRIANLLLTVFGHESPADNCYRVASRAFACADRIIFQKGDFVTERRLSGSERQMREEQEQKSGISLACWPFGHVMPFRDFCEHLNWVVPAGIMFDFCKSSVWVQHYYVCVQCIESTNIQYTIYNTIYN